MTSFVVCHGGSAKSGCFIPKNVNLYLYTDMDSYLAEDHALAILGGSGESGTPHTETIFPNYRLEELGDKSLRKVARVVSLSGNTALPVGKGRLGSVTALCSSPETCTDAHTCQGLLGVLSDRTDIRLLACTPAFPGSETLEDKSSITEDVDQDYRKAMEHRENQDETSFEELYDGLPDARRNTLMTNKWVYVWAIQRHFIEYLNANGDAAFYTYFLETCQEEERSILEKECVFQGEERIAILNAALERAFQEISNLADDRWFERENFYYGIWVQLPEKVRADVRDNNPDLDAWLTTLG
ncbi:hypothetical protein [Streptomyces sp. NPDC059918]|uniref:hypothetical protein n=1 Tax=unclassified Streptomyces TaxID=2593676 RepID=UPI00365FF2A7